MSGENLVPLAPSYDTPGFFTRDLTTMAAIASVFQKDQTPEGPVTFWLPSDLWSLVDDGVAGALRASRPAGECRLDPLLPGGDLTDWLHVFRIHQGYEIWQALGPWIEQHQPDFGPGIRERFDTASKISKQEFDSAVERRSAIRSHLETSIAPTTILVFPSSPGVAPLRTTPQEDLDVFRNAALTLLCVAGHAGLPQISVPLAIYDGAPIGLSLLGARGTDMHMIAAAQTFAPVSLAHT